MSKRRKQKRPPTADPRSIRPGDYLILQVPPNRFLETGTHRARVESLAAKLRHHDGIRVKCCIVVNGVDFDDVDFDSKALVVYFEVTVYHVSKLQGQCFLGPDQFPAEYRHEPNLLRRLEESFPVPERPRHNDY